jgi:hypothetical protein
MPGIAPCGGFAAGVRGPVLHVSISVIGTVLPGTSQDFATQYVRSGGGQSGREGRAIRQPAGIFDV